MSDLPAVKDERIEITVEPDGRQKIVFKKSILQGKVKSNDVLNAILIAARLQTEKYIEKLSRGASLEPNEIKALKELAEIAKIDLPSQDTQPAPVTSDIEQVKSTLYQALTERLTPKP